MDPRVAQRGAPATTRRRGEEGQVYPALLLAVIGGLALVVAFVGLQNLLDQDGRAESASDAAALAAGTAFRDNTTAALTGSGIQGVISLLQNGGDFSGLDEVAQQYAEANGASTVGSVDYDGFDAGQARWEFSVTTQQNDTVKAGSKQSQERSRSRVAVTANGFCDGFTGIRIGGSCKSPADLLTACVAPDDPPDTVPVGDKPKPPKETPKPFDPADFCDSSLADLLQWNVKLTQ